MNAKLALGQILRIGLVSVVLTGVSAWAQSAAPSTPGLKTNDQRMAEADTAAKAAPTTTIAATDKPESLQVANKEYDAVKELARMTKLYDLSKEQKAKIESLLLEQQKQVHTLGEDESLTDAQWTAAVRAVHQATVLKVKKLLTDEQLSMYTKDEAKRAKQSENDSDADDDGPPDGPPPDGGASRWARRRTGRGTRWRRWTRRRTRWRRWTRRRTGWRRWTRLACARSCNVFGPACETFAAITRLTFEP